MSSNGLRAVVERPQAFRSEGLGYVYEPPGLWVRLRADYLHRRSDEFTAEVVIERTDSPVAPLLHMARLNLVSTASRRTLANHLKEVCSEDGTLDYKWSVLLEQFCIEVVRRQREGSPFYRASEMRAVARPPDLIPRLLPGTGPCMWFAPQGTGKGWTGEIACAAIAAGEPFAGLPTRRALPLYLDWEDSPEVWHERLLAVSLGLDLDELPDVRYRQCRQRLAADLPAILRYVQTEGIGLVVIDSVGAAMGASDGQRMDEQAIGLFESLRHLSPLPVLLIDHMTGEAAGNGPQKEDKAFGSIYKMAEVRTAWAMRKEQDTDADEQDLAFYHRKHNHTKKFPAIGVRLCFESDAQGWAQRVWLEKADVRDSDLLSKGLSQAEQILAYLRRCGPSTGEAIAEGVGLKGNQTRTILGRLAKRNMVVKRSDGQWALGVAPSVAEIREV